MKKLFALLLTLAMVLSLAACGGGKTEAPAASGDKPAATETEKPADSGKTYKVAMICDSSISDGGWGMACYNAMIAAAEKYGWETAYSDSIDQSAYYDNIVSYCDLGYDLIYAPGNQYTDAVLQAAEEYPDIIGLIFQSDNSEAAVPIYERFFTVFGGKLAELPIYENGYEVNPRGAKLEPKSAGVAVQHLTVPKSSGDGYEIVKYQYSFDTENKRLNKQQVRFYGWEID